MGAGLVVADWYQKRPGRFLMDVSKSRCASAQIGWLGMSYTFKGRLCGYVCERCEEPLSNLTVRLYRVAGDRDVTALAAAQPKETFAFLSDEDVQAKISLLLAEAQTDAEGNFSVELPANYDGGPFEVDVYCATMPRPKVSRHAHPLQFSITTLQPEWVDVDGSRTASWEHCIDVRYWCRVLARFGVWTICGHLVTCQGQSPIPGATVKAFDRDWLQDDGLGSAVTNSDGHFLISYTVDEFKKTPFPFIDIELVGGPDVYFSAELGGTTILQEDPSVGRSPERANIGPCFCVELCSGDVVGSGGPETVPHWMQVAGTFNIHPDAGQPSSAFSADGYAGDPADPNADAYVFGGSPLELNGNCPLTNIVTGNPVKYRFLFGEYTWSTSPGDPTTMPSIPPAGALTPLVSQFAGAKVGFVSYIDGNGVQQWADVDVDATDPDGWITVNGTAVTVPMFNPPGSTAVVTVNESNFLETFTLSSVNTDAITAVHPPTLPGGFAQTDAGKSLTTAQEEPIRRYTVQFEARDTVTDALLGSDTLSSIIFNNSPIVLALDLTELLANMCNPVGSATDVHILYTIDHPHLRSYSVSISNNNGQVHPPPAYSGSPTLAMPSGNYTPGDFFFRGGESGTGAVAVDISADPPCAYRVSLSWQTRIWQDPGHSTEILYCT